MADVLFLVAFFAPPAAVVVAVAVVAFASIPHRVVSKPPLRQRATA